MHSELILCLFARLLGFFFVSPLFTTRSVPLITRALFAATLTLLFAPLLITNAPQLPQTPLALLLIGEVAIGYFLGFLFALILEAATLAGEVVGTLGGFSAVELLDPVSLTGMPIFGKVFGLIVLVLIVATDLHHALLRTLYESFFLIPAGAFSFPKTVLWTLIEGGSGLFVMALSYAFAPFVVLSLFLLLLALISRALPTLPIFWLSFPMQLLLGLLATAASFAAFPEIVARTFSEMQHLAMRILLALSGSM